MTKEYLLIGEVGSGKYKIYSPEQIWVECIRQLVILTRLNEQQPRDRFKVIEQKRVSDKWLKRANI